MDNLAGILRKVLRVPDHAIIEPRSNTDKNITVLHGHVALIGPMHTGHTQELLIGRGVCPQAH